MRAGLTALLLLSSLGLISCASPEDVRPAERAARRVRIAELEVQIARLEAECAPATGMTRTAVETLHGSGTVAFPGAAHTMARCLTYQCDERVELLVLYDDAWRVALAKYHDPTLEPIRWPLGKPITGGPLWEEALRRSLATLERVRDSR